MAVDRQTIADVVLGGRTTLSSQPSVREAFGHDPSIATYLYDVAKALGLRQKVMRSYHDDAPSIFMCDNVAFIGLSPRTKGYSNIFGFVPYEKVTLG